jgi:hypothetical protein
MEREVTQLELSGDERALLGELLESAYRELKAEIGRTEGFAFKGQLKAREATLVALMDKVAGGHLEI